MSIRLHLMILAAAIALAGALPAAAEPESAAPAAPPTETAPAVAPEQPPAPAAPSNAAATPPAPPSPSAPAVAGKTTPTDPDFAKGLDTYNKQDYAAAVSSFETAIRSNPKSAETYYYLGYSFYKMKKFDESRTAFIQAYQLHPDYRPPLTIPR